MNRMKCSQTLFRTLALLAPLSLAACSSAVRRVDLPAGSDPQPRIIETEARLEGDRAKQYDLLSPRHFKRAEQALTDAHKKSEKGVSSDKILNDVGQAMAELQIVEDNGQKSSEGFRTVLSARQAAKLAKADSTSSSDFKAADEELQSFGEDIEANDFHADSSQISALEGRYSDLELTAIRNANLGYARALFEKSEKAGAERKAPATYSTAKVLYDSATRSIEGNRHNPEAYRHAVADSAKSAEKLDRVLKTIQGSKTSEAVAVQIFDQQQQLVANQASLNEADSNAKTAAIAAALQKQDAEAKDKAGRQDMQALKGENQQYAEREALNQKIESIKAEFKPSEAEVVRDGMKIVIRLKSMRFSTARFELTSSSLGTLQKVKDMIAAVPVSMVVVEGHTDAIGTSESNQKLSQNRAEAVRRYFIADKTLSEDKVKAKGLGYERPLTTNKTKEGRATNRRVDVIIETTSTM